MMPVTSNFALRPAIARPVIGMVLLTVSFFALALLASNAHAAQTVTTSETSSRLQLWNSALAPGAKPKASAKVKRCVVSRFYDGRRIVFSGRMVRFSDTNTVQTLQMKFEVLRKFREHRRYKKVKGTGLGEWLPASDPAATIYVRELALEGVETAAHYRARVTYRWLAADGTVEFKRVRSTRPCHQRIALPQLVFSSSKRVPASGSGQENFIVSVYNAGASEAVNAPIFLSIDDAPAQGTIIGSIGPRQSADINFTGSACQGKYAVALDPLRKLRLSKTFRGWSPTTCPR